MNEIQKTKMNPEGRPDYDYIGDDGDAKKLKEFAVEQFGRHVDGCILIGWAKGKGVGHALCDAKVEDLVNALGCVLEEYTDE